MGCPWVSENDHWNIILISSTHLLMNCSNVDLNQSSPNCDKLDARAHFLFSLSTMAQRRTSGEDTRIQKCKTAKTAPHRQRRAHYWNQARKDLHKNEGPSLSVSELKERKECQTRPKRWGAAFKRSCLHDGCIKVNRSQRKERKWSVGFTMASVVRHPSAENGLSDVFFLKQR